MDSKLNTVDFFYLFFDIKSEVVNMNDIFLYQFEGMKNIKNPYSQT